MLTRCSMEHQARKRRAGEFVCSGLVSVMIPCCDSEASGDQYIKKKRLPCAPHRCMVAERC